MSGAALAALFGCCDFARPRVAQGAAGGGKESGGGDGGGGGGAWASFPPPGNEGKAEHSRQRESTPGARDASMARAGGSYVRVPSDVESGAGHAATEAPAAAALPTRTKETWVLNKSRDEASGRKRINQYTKIRALGQGSYGKVVLYEDERGGVVAVKVLARAKLRKAVVSGHTALTDAMREVAIMKQLHCDQVVRLIEVIDDLREEKLYLVMEFAQGGVAMEPVRREKAMRESDAARQVVADAASGTAYLHARGVCHLDIKPENLLMFSGGRAKLGDMGVSQAFSGENDSLLRSPGTPAFFSPECCVGGEYSGRAADCWALGVTIYCLVFGSYPFIGNTEAATYAAIQRSELVLPRGTSAELESLLRGLLHPDPGKRMCAADAACHPWLGAHAKRDAYALGAAGGPSDDGSRP